MYVLRGGIRNCTLFVWSVRAVYSIGMVRVGWSGVERAGGTVKTSFPKSLRIVATCHMPLLGLLDANKYTTIMLHKW